MLSSIIGAGFNLFAIASGLAGSIYFYWRLADRRLTNTDERQRWFNENYKGDTVTRGIVSAKVGSVSCYPPEKIHKKILRGLTLDYGYTDITLAFEGREIPDVLWDELDEMLNNDIRTIQSSEYNKGADVSFITIRITGFDTERFEDASAVAVNFVRTYQNQSQSNIVGSP
ncbi:hypothetical protein VB773_13255 [Haloarculaceae archaeon H-GB2-1]|nr:hypothetical protein [Haloarculaceae archaeon H-GB1-1]MEA5386931.1 hypothetical protein [Haloarculaceae archaeon H-GB11]MEA5408437.1 hypothetical protein [Haloarculaceae archaeon H-GB2-1]